MGNEIKVYSKADFLESTEPYEFLYGYMNDRFTLERLLAQISEQAKAYKLNFNKMFKAYCDAQKKSKSLTYAENATNFEDQEMQLDTGIWQADDFGITKETMFGEVAACVHPIMPVQRLVNVDTGIEKLKLAYKKGRGWRSLIVDKKTLAGANSILSLADYGVAVTSENAKHLVTYIHDVENLNYDKIPEFNSVGRLGWIGDMGFSPYVENLIFDGDAQFENYFNSVRPRGKYEKWMEVAGKARKDNTCTRIMLAASFASVLVAPCNGLPFFVHLWGGTETGKTVGLMLAASVWADPEMGKYIHTFNSTSVAQELSATFVNSMPLIIDELQIQRDKKDFDSMIYQLTEGVGRSRGKKTGGLQSVGRWANCILTTGEQPIINRNSGAGAVNRIIEINCEDMKLFNDPIGVVNTVKRNHGFAGKKFVEILKDPAKMEEMKELQKAIYKDIVSGDTTEKQALAASLILTADTLLDMYMFEGTEALTLKDLTQFLSTKSDVSSSNRAYAFIKEWVVQNKNKFKDSDEHDVWGRLNGTDVYIIRSIFNKVCIENGFSPDSFLHWLRSNNLIDAPVKGFSKTKRVNGLPCNCIVMRLSEDGFEEVCDEEAMDFDEGDQTDMLP